MAAVHSSTLAFPVRGWHAGWVVTLLKAVLVPMAIATAVARHWRQRCLHLPACPTRPVSASVYQRILISMVAMMVVIAATSALPARAESFLGLEPLETLASVRQRFPGAKLDPEHPAWLKLNQYYCMLDADGADGLVALLFEHDDDKRRQKLADLQKSLPSTVNHADNPQAKSISLLIRQQHEALARPLEERLSLVRIRWIPDKPQRLGALQAKYGKPDAIHLNVSGVGPVYVWDRGVHAYLTTDRKQAKMIEFWFTEDDLAEVFLRR